MVSMIAKKECLCVSAKERDGCFYQTILLLPQYMKKAAAILFLFLFLFTNSGMAVNVHWCGGKIASVDFFSDGKHHCPCGKKMRTGGCCKDKTVTLKANHELAKVNQFALKISLPKFEMLEARETEIVSSTQLQHFTSDFYHPPPYKPRTPIFLLDRVIRI